MGDISDLANIIYGEAASEDYDTMHMVGSTVLNRLTSGKTKEFGESLPEIIQKGYYAARGNVPYKQALSQKFPDEKSETKYKQAYAIASGLIKKTIKPREGMFFFDKDEIPRQRKAGFKFKQVKDVGKVGKYSVYSY